MSAYEYECQKCGYRFEKSQKMSDEPLKSCPKCKGPIRRFVSGRAGIIFRSSGVYATDCSKSDSLGRTCCGRTERCDKSPCPGDGVCKK